MKRLYTWLALSFRRVGSVSGPGENKIAAGGLQTAGGRANVAEVEEGKLGVLKIELHIELNFATVLAVVSFLLAVATFVYALVS